MFTKILVAIDGSHASENDLADDGGRSPARHRREG
jgi:hypothetical protein